MNFQNDENAESYLRFSQFALDQKLFYYQYFGYVYRRVLEIKRREVDKNLPDDVINIDKIEAMIPEYFSLLKTSATEFPTGCLNISITDWSVKETLVYLGNQEAINSPLTGRIFSNYYEIAFDFPCIKNQLKKVVVFIQPPDNDKSPTKAHSFKAPFPRRHTNYRTFFAPIPEEKFTLVNDLCDDTEPVPEQITYFAIGLDKNGTVYKTPEVSLSFEPDTSCH